MVTITFTDAEVLTLQAMLSFAGSVDASRYVSEPAVERCISLDTRIRDEIKRQEPGLTIPACITDW